MRSLPANSQKIRVVADASEVPRHFSDLQSQLPLRQPVAAPGVSHHLDVFITIKPFELSQLELRYPGTIMSYYFTIIGTRDNPLFEHEFGTSKAGGDGIARFRDEARHMNQFIVHSSLDIVEEVQWGNNGLYDFSILLNTL